MKQILVFSSNNFYYIHALALIRSIELNCKVDNLEIHIFSDGIKPANKSIMKKATTSPIVYHEFDKTFLEQNPLPQKTTYLPRSAYLRLFIPLLFKDEERVLYLDVDTIVLSSLQELFDLPFDGKSCLACLDYGETTTKSKVRQIFMKDADSPYFNSGVMMINVQKWIEAKVKQRAFNLLENEMKSPEFADQEVLNVILENDWLQLEPSWNYPPHVSDYSNMPKIIHFMGYKPIYKDYKDRHKDTFYSFLKGSKWENKDYGLIKKALIKGPYRIKSSLIKFRNRYL